MTLKDVVFLLNNFISISSKKEQIDRLYFFFKKLSIDEAYLLASILNGNLYNMYNFQLSSKLLIKIVALFFNKEESLVERQFHVEGDLGKTFLFFSSNFDNPIQLTDSIPFIQLDLFFKELHSITGKNSQEKKIELFLIFLKKISSLEGCYVIKIILDLLRLTVSEMTILSVLKLIAKDHSMVENGVEEAYFITLNLKKIIEAIYTKNVLLLNSLTAPIIFHPIYPAAANRLNSKEDLIELCEKGCIAQIKYDGLRVQIHINNYGEEIKFYSRNLKSFDFIFPEILEDLKKGCKARQIKNGIFEGEVIVFDTEKNIHRPFADVTKRRRKHNIAITAEKFPIQCVFFDCLYINNRSLLNNSSIDRYNILKQYVLETDHIKVIDTYLFNDAALLTDFFNKTIKEGHEGIIIKKKEAGYHKGKRSSAWIKWKKSNTDILGDTLDLIILGYYHGKGKFKNRLIGSILVGILDEITGIYQTVAKIGSGLEEQEWINLKNVLKPINSENFSYNISKALTPDVTVQPAIIVEIEGDLITKSTEHTSGYSIRFPRLKKIRKDKTINQATTKKELDSFFASINTINEN